MTQRTFRFTLIVLVKSHSPELAKEKIIKVFKKQYVHPVEVRLDGVEQI